MIHYKPIDRAAFVLFKKDSFSYDTFFPDTIPSYVTLFETRFLLTEWKECLLKNSLFDTNEMFWYQISAIIKKKFVRYP